MQPYPCFSVTRSCSITNVPTASPLSASYRACIDKKIKTLAKQSKRSYNKQPEYILETYIREYEVQHGEIPCSEE